VNAEAQAYDRMTEEDVKLINELRSYGIRRMMEIEDEIKDLKKEWKQLKEQTGIKAIAEKFERHETTITRLLNGTTWRDRK